VILTPLAWTGAPSPVQARSPLHQSVQRAAGPAPGDSGPAVNTTLQGPSFLALDHPGGHLYITDYTDNRVRVVDLHTGIITTVAGDGEGNNSGDGGSARDAGVLRPNGIALDDAGHLYIADDFDSGSGPRVRMVDLHTGIIKTIAGGIEKGDSGDGGPALKARFESLGSFALDPAGLLYVSDTEASRVRVIDLHAGVISAVVSEKGNGGLALDHDATHLYISDLASSDNSDFVGDNSVHVLDLKTGAVTLIAGNSHYGYSGDGGPARDAELSNPSGLAVDDANHLYIADSNNVAVRRVDLRRGIISTVIGDEQKGDTGDGGPAIYAQMQSPVDVLLDGAGHIYVTDYDAGRVRVVDLKTSIISAVVGTEPGLQPTSIPEPTGTPEPTATPVPPRLRVAGVALPGNVASTHWGPLFQRSRPSVPVSVVSASSAQGVRALASGQANIVLRSGPLTPAQHSVEDDRCASSSVLRVPVALDGAALVVRLPNLSAPLRVTPAVLAALYDGAITRWNDARIAALNPHAKLADLVVTPLYRSDGNRATDILRTYLRRVSVQWRAAVARGGRGSWPTGRGVAGGTALAQAVASMPGAVGYLDLSTAHAAQMPLLALLDRAGGYAAASSSSISAAAMGATTDVMGGRTPDLIDAASKRAYPLVYAIMADACGGSSVEARTVAAYLAAALSVQGQQAVADAGDAPLPPSVRAAALTRSGTTAP